jgi:hypothetical protein
MRSGICHHAGGTQGRRPQLNLDRMRVPLRRGPRAAEVVLQMADGTCVGKEAPAKQKGCGHHQLEEASEVG